MKKLRIFLISLFLMLPLGVKAETKEPVKVYMFEAGGCPYCEQEQAYLEGLDSYNTKFVIVKKQLYVDHETWVHGADYNLGVRVAKAFKAAGFKNADYKGTPFVVISDLYATTRYDTELETYIDQAYEAGDKDIVSCISEGKDDCLPKKAGISISPKALIIIGVSFVLIIGAVVFLNFQFNKVILEKEKVEKDEGKLPEEKNKPKAKKKSTTSKAKK